MITQKSIEEVLETAKVDEVIEEFVNLKNAGVNKKGLCPFHNEKTPSFVVSPVKNIYKCFGCGKGGHSVQFLMELEKMSFPEAIRWLAAKYNIELEETKQSDENIQERQHAESLFLVNQFAKEHFIQNLFETNDGRNIALSYFKERGLIESTIKKFGLGWAAKANDSFLQQAQTKGFKKSYLQELGIIKNDRDFFRDRVMFPIHNLSGKVIGFGGRTLSKEKKIPKYINSIESEIYEKRKTLYGMFLAKHDIRKSDHCILVEGYTDVISLHQAGIENAVASSGTSLTIDQIRLIKRYTNTIVVLFDGDPAGVKAAMRGLDLILAQDMMVKMVLLPDQEDPDSYLKKIGADAFTKFLVDHAQDFILFKAKLLLKESGHDPIKKSIIIKDIVASVALIPDPIRRALYVKESANLLDIDEGILHNQANRVIKERNKKNSRSNYKQDTYDDYIEVEKKKVKALDQAPQVRSDLPQEEALIRLLVTCGNRFMDKDETITVAKYILTEIQELKESFEVPLYGQIIKDMFDLIDEKGVIPKKYFSQSPNPEIQNITVDFLAPEYTYASWAAKGQELQTQKDPEENQLLDTKLTVLRFREKKLRKVIHECNEEIKRLYEEDSDQLPIYLKAQMRFKKELSIINEELGTVVLE